MGLRRDLATGFKTETPRRDFLRAGLFGGAVATLAGWLEREAAAGIHSSSKAVVFVHLDGGPAQLVSRPVSYKDVFAPVYHNLGIDPHRTALTDPQGRPQHLLDEGESIRELV